MTTKSIICSTVLAMAAITAGNAAAGTRQASCPDDTAAIEAANADSLTAALKDIAGTWQYKSPAVEAKGKNVISRLGKPIAKSKIKKKLGKAFDKLKLKSMGAALELTTDGKCRVKLPGHDFSGRYTYDASTLQITLFWHDIPIKARLARKGGKECQLLFDIDKVLAAFQLLSAFSHNPAVKMLATLANNYTDVMIGFSLKRR